MHVAALDGSHGNFLTQFATRSLDKREMKETKREKNHIRFASLHAIFKDFIKLHLKAEDLKVFKSSVTFLFLSLYSQKHASLLLFY